MLNWLGNILFPPRCLGCNEFALELGKLCAACWIKINFNTNNCCKICGIPFEYEVDCELLCGACIQEAPLYLRAYSVFLYDQHGKVLIHKLKYQDKAYLAPYYAKWMMKTASQSLQNVDLIIPVPMRSLRLLRRLYNQAALLSYYLSKYSGVPMLACAIIRSRYTKSQFGLTKQERVQNLHNAFSIKTSYRNQIKDKKILLIDDVFTTGATINECVKILLRVGATSVKVLTLARTAIK